MSLIIHDGDSLDSGHYSSDEFDVKTGTWWQYDDEKTVQISDLKEGVYTSKGHKHKYTKKNYVRYKKIPING